MPAEVRESAPGVWVGDRRIAHVGVAVRDWVTSFGCTVNVNPDLKLFRHVHCDGDARSMTSAERERRGKVRPLRFGSACSPNSYEQFGFDRVALFHHHPALSEKAPCPCSRYPSWLKRPRRPVQTIAAVAEAIVPERQRELLHQRAAARTEAGDGLRERPLPQSAGVLFAPHRHVHDPRQRLHPAVRLLLGAARRHRCRSRTTSRSAWRRPRYRLGLKHVVITSVTRDDLPDGGADHFYRCVLAVRQRTGAAVEVLTPDFLGDIGAIDRVLAAEPEVFNHNMETVPRLYRKVRGRADYRRSLDLLAHVKRAGAADRDQERPDARPRRNDRRTVRRARRPARRSTATC